jgi:hypothetical protein
MPDSKIIRVYYEGDDDRALLEGLKVGSLIPEPFEIVKRNKAHAGQEGLVHELAAFVLPSKGVAGSAIAIFDLDDRSPDQLVAWLQKKLAEEATKEDAVQIAEAQAGNPRVRLLTISKGGHTGHVSFVAAGLPENSELKTVYGIEEFGPGSISGNKA